MHDLIIRGGTIADGSGRPTRTGDVAIDGRIITAVGEVEGPAHRVIDADGLLVTPGWVDIHTHYDGQATWDPEVSPSGWHGVTTVVMGNCGVGFAPVRRDGPRVADPAHGGRGGHPGHRAGRGHELELGDVRRVPRRGGADRRVSSTWPRWSRTARCGPTCSARAGPTTPPRRRRSPRWPPSCARPCTPGPSARPRRARCCTGPRTASWRPGRRPRPTSWSPSARRWARRGTGSSRWPATCATSTTSSPGCRRSRCGPACP